jgi:hypothetical protein
MPSSFADENTFVGASLAPAVAGAADPSIVAKPGAPATVEAAASICNSTATTPSGLMKTKQKNHAVSQQRRAFGDISNRKKEAPPTAAGLPTVSKSSSNIHNNNALPKTPFAPPATATKPAAAAAVQILNDNSKNILNIQQNGKEVNKNNKQRRVGFILPDKENSNNDNDHLDDTFVVAAVLPKPSSSSTKNNSSIPILQENSADNDDVDAIEMPAGRTWLQQQEHHHDSDDDDDVLSVEEYLIDPVAIMAQRLAIQDEMEEEAVTASWNVLERKMAQLFVTPDDDNNNNNNDDRGTI